MENISQTSQGDQLRPYQSQGITEIFKRWREGKRSVLFQMPTGTGKTVLFSEIVKKGFTQNKSILIVVHRKELVEQIRDKLHSKNVDLGIIMAGYESDPNKKIQIASIQTLNNREIAEPNLIIIDECHHAKAETYTALWTKFPSAKILGVTATPVRLSGEGFDDIFDDLITSQPLKYFIDNGYLVPIKHFVCSNPNLSSVKQSKGDYVTKMLTEVMMDNSVMSDLTDSYLEKCSGKSMIVFAVDVEHSKEITKRYRENGITAEHIDAKTPLEERQKILQNFKSKKVSVVSNVEIITEGFDFPQCEVVQLARPTKSLALYLQMVGRVMRPAQGKTAGIIMDNAGLWLDHGLSFVEREWDLKGMDKKKKKDAEKIVAIDKDGFIKTVNRSKPQEIKGLNLIELNAELERLIIFEGQLKFSTSQSFNLLNAYHEYKAYLEQKRVALSEIEFEYIRKRLNFLNKKMPEQKRFNSGFWYHEAGKLGFKKPKWEP
jgi:superfamily II DNA or RNA helicase